MDEEQRAWDFRFAGKSIGEKRRRGKVPRTPALPRISAKTSPLKVPTGEWYARQEWHWERWENSQVIFDNERIKSYQKTAIPLFDQITPTTSLSPASKSDLTRPFDLVGTGLIRGTYLARTYESNIP